MTGDAADFTIGIEEEYQLINAETRALVPRIAPVLREAQHTVGAEVQPELYRSQIEIASPVCHTLREVRAALVRLRRGVIAAAAHDGNRVAAAGTHPFSHWDAQALTPKERYHGIAEEYQQIARELVIFGCHVHVGLRDPEDRVQVMNRTRVWLAPLLALTANSPFWLGNDTGYASFRTELWHRFPTAGPPQLFASRAEYAALVQTLVATGSIEDATKIYWDVRLPERVATVEVRVADVCMTIDEAVMVAGLVRGLVKTCHAQALRGDPRVDARPEVLRAAHWRAARYGLEADLIDVEAGRAVPARELIERLLTFIRPALEQDGAWEEVSTLVRETMRRGTGAQRQRQAYHRAGRMEDVVDLIVAETTQGTGVQQH